MKTNQLKTASVHETQRSGVSPTVSSPSDVSLTLIAGISRPAALQRISQGLDEGPETVLYGCDQNWYHDSFQQKAGCGPCAATNLLHYAGKPPDENGAAQSHELPDFVHLMHEVWKYVTPGLGGVHRTSQLADGLDRYAREHHLPLKAVLLDVPVRRSRRPKDQAVIDFITDGLTADSPVAFLNRSNGVLTELESWHWVTITALFSRSDGACLAEISNYGTRSLVNMSLWLASTRLGGGFVYSQNSPGRPAN